MYTTMDERLKKAAVEGDVAFLREAVASGKPIEYLRLHYVPRHAQNEVGGNIFHLAAVNQRVEFIAEALEILPFLDAHFLVNHDRNHEFKAPLHKDFLLGKEELVRVVEEFYKRRNPMDCKLKDAAINGDVGFLREAFCSNKPLEYFLTVYYPCPTWNEQGGNILHLAAHHGRVDFFQVAIQQLPISEVDILLWQQVPTYYFGNKNVFEMAGRVDGCRNEIFELIQGIYTSRNTMDEQLKEAAIRGDIEFLREAVASGKPVDYFLSLCFVLNPGSNEQMGNIFHLAIWNRREPFLKEAIKILFEAGVDVHLLMCQQDHPKSQRTPLLVAAQSSLNRTVKLILDFYHDKSLFAESTSNGTDSPSVNVIKPWLIKDAVGFTGFYYIISCCREECALKLLSVDPELSFQMDSYPQVDVRSSPLITALEKGYSKLVLKFLVSHPKWDAFDKRVVAAALGYAPYCSDKIFKIVLEHNLQVVNDGDFYRIWSPVMTWTSIGKLYPFEYVLKDELRAPVLRNYLIDLMSTEFPEYSIACDYYDEDKAIKIAQILIDTYEKERREQFNSLEIERPWFVKSVYFKGSLLQRAIEYRREKFVLYFLSLEKIELLLEEDNQFLFLAIQHRCDLVAQKILDLIEQHGLNTLLTCDSGYSVLHVAPQCKGDFLRKLLKQYPKLMEQSDEDGVTIIHTWMEMGEVWPFQCILNKDEFSFDMRRKFIELLGKVTAYKRTNPLHVAAGVTASANGTRDRIVQFLFDAIREQNLQYNYFKVEDEDIDGNTPIDIALSTGREELTLCFLSALPPYHINPRTTNILFKAIENKCHQVVKFLLYKIYMHDWAHSDLHKEKQNVLHVASDCTVENARAIVERWPELISEKDENEETPLETASAAGADWLVELILLKNHTCILTTPLVWVKACERGHLSTVVTFIEKSTYFRHICRKYHDTPLHHIKLEDYNKYQELLRIPLIQDPKG